MPGLLPQPRFVYYSRYSAVCAGRCKVYSLRPNYGDCECSDREAGRTTVLENRPIFTIEAELEAIITLGGTPHGERRFVGIAGGIVKGSILNGRVLPGGADWQVVRSDGATDIQARYIIEADTGGRVMIDSKGLRYGPPEVLEKLARGEKIDPNLYYFRTVMRFETADPALHWLNRILALARGQREALSVRLEVYEVK